MKIKIFVLLFFLFSIQDPELVRANELTPDLVGSIYLKGTAPGPTGKAVSPPLFTLKAHYTEDSEGRTTSSSSIVDSTGKSVLTEVSTYQGSKLLSQSVEQVQTGHRYTVTRKEDKIYFKDEETTGSKKIEEDSIDASEHFITGPTTRPFLAEHWAELLDGKTVHCRFGVLEARETYGFNFKLKRKETVANRELFVISMRPSSFFNNFLFSILEGDIEIYMDPTTKRYARYKGITPVQRVDEKGKLHRFSAEIIYE